MKNYYSIYKSNGNWFIKTSSNVEQLTKSPFRTQKDAIAAAKSLIKNGGVIAVHASNGEVRDVISQPSSSWGIKKANTSYSKVNKQVVFKTLANKIEKDKV